jgi:chorismate synthase
MSNTFGEVLRLSIFGESHGAAIGAVLDGLPPGETIDWDGVRKEMERRAPARNALSTARKEKDAFEIESGYFNDHTTGTPLCVMIRNSDQHSRDYEELRHVMRPGHADYTGRVRYDGYNDYRGGGHFSGRLTAPLVFAGAIAQQILARRGVTVGAHILQICSIMDLPFSPLGEQTERLLSLKDKMLPVLDDRRAGLMEQAILQAKNEINSVGGIIECMATGLPPGLGNPFFDSIESRLSHMLFSVPAVKGLEFGDGFALAYMNGSEANDAMRYDGDQVKTETNHNGGILGGITNGMPVLFRLVIKPTASIGQKQKTVDIDTKENCVLEIKGRHDPCIVQRAVPVIEAVTAWTLLDSWMMTEKGR